MAKVAYALAVGDPSCTTPLPCKPANEVPENGGLGIAQRGVSTCTLAES